MRCNTINSIKNIFYLIFILFFNQNYSQDSSYDYTLKDVNLTESEYLNFLHSRNLDNWKRFTNPTKDEALKYAHLLGKKHPSQLTLFEIFLNEYLPTDPNKLFPLIIISTSLLVCYMQIALLKPSSFASTFTMYQPGEIKENFDSVAGNDEAKQAFKDIVEYLKNPEVYDTIGAKPTKGILLTGAPGTGKTLLARALAGEANCAFIYASGSEFNTMWVGSGAENIKALFNQARGQAKWGNKKKVPCILFIDEIEVLARHRGNSLDNHGDQTVNELLTQLDGFVQEENPVIIIAATNFPEKIDSALLRPGRIDRTIHIETPDLKDRKEILELHLHKIKHTQEINLTLIAQRTIGFTGADLAEIIHASARIAANRKAKQVEQEDIENALDMKTIGARSKRPLSKKERSIIAYHESGHALVSMLLNPQETVNKITILPRGHTLGVTYFLKKEEIERLTTKEEFLNKICILLAGRAAEEIIFNIISTSPSSDLETASNIAHAMINHYGMGTSLMVATHSNKLSEATIEKEIEKLLTKAYEKAKELLTKNIDKLHKLAQEVLAKETLNAQEIADLQII
jgi:cell division protease FtsH